MNIIKDLIKKYGAPFVLGAVTLDGYRRQLLNDRASNILTKIEEEKAKLSESEKELFIKGISMVTDDTKNKAVIADFVEAADKHKINLDLYQKNPSPHNNSELEKSTQHIQKLITEMKNLNYTDYITSLYHKYNDYLATLSLDKIVCLFNIIMSGIIFSSFFTVLSLMLSENIINKIVFIEKYPRIGKLLKWRTNINKKISKFHLYMHLFTIILTFIGNIYMFFL